MSQISCEVIRGPVQTDGSRISLSLLSVQMENKPPTTVLRKPHRNVTSIKHVNFIVDPQTVEVFRTHLHDQTVPPPEVTGYKLELYWNGHRFAHNNADKYDTNFTGVAVPTFDTFHFSSVIPPPEKEGEATILLLTHFPAEYNPSDRLEMRKEVLTDKFSKLPNCQHVYLYVYPHLLSTYTELIPNFCNAWKAVIPMENIQWCMNDFFGKKEVGKLAPIRGTIQPNTEFMSSFMLTDAVLPASKIETVKPRGLTTRSPFYKHLDVETKALHSASRIIVYVNDPVDRPFTSIQFNGGENIMVTPVEMEHSEILFKCMINYEQIILLRNYKEKLEWLTVNPEFVHSFQFKSLFTPFLTMEHASPYVTILLTYMCESLHPAFRSLIKDTSQEQYTSQYDIRQKHHSAKNGTTYHPSGFDYDAPPRASLRAVGSEGVRF